MSMWRWLRLLPWAILSGLSFLSCVRGSPPVVAAPAQGTLRVDFIAVGHGDSILVTSTNGKRLLIDGGEAEAAPTILAHLRRRGACPLDVILLTHAHSDHAGGLAKIIEECGARMFVDSGYPHSSAIYARLLEKIEQRKVQLLQAQPGRQFDLGEGATLTLLGPPQPFIDRGAEGANANSVVSRLSLGKTSVLFTGDADVAEEKWLLAHSASLQSTVLKVGHHGSRTSSSSEFLRAVAPRLAVISNWPDAPKHPHPETLVRLGEARARVLETGREGTIQLELDGKTIAFRTEKHPTEAPMP